MIPLEAWLLAGAWLAIIGGPICAGWAIRVRLRRRSWPTPPHPRAVVVLAVVIITWADDRGRHWAAGVREDLAEGDLPNRVASFVLSGALLLRAGIHIAVWLAGRDDAPEAEHNLRACAVEWPTVAGQWIAAALCGATAGLLLVAQPPLDWGWPPLVETAARTWLRAQWMILALDPAVVLARVARENGIGLQLTKIMTSYVTTHDTTEE